MKVLMINKFLYPRGGSESYMLKLGEHLKSLGHEVEYFGMYDEKNTVGNSSDLYTKNMDFHSGKLGRFLYPFRIIYSFEAKKKLSAVLDSFKPDVVHMNNINFQLTPSIIYAVKKRNIPLVQTVHDYQMICPNHLLYSFSENKNCERCLRGSKLNCLKYSCIHGSKIKSLIGVIESWFYALLGTYKLVDLYICPSNFLESKLISAKKFYRGKTYTIHNFIEKKAFEKDENPKPYIFFAGRLSKEKGVELLADTARLMGEYEFVVAGDGPDREYLENIPNVTLRGFLNGKELVDAMANARVLVAPSVCYENCPLSILEGYSMGVPAVAMNYGGMAELVKDGVTGSLSAPEPESLAKALKKVMCDDEYYKMLKENCVKEFENIYSVDTYCDILIEKYNSVR